MAWLISRNSTNTTSSRTRQPGGKLRQQAEFARLLALNLAHYQGKYGDIPLDETLAVLDAEEPNDEQAKLLADSMQNLVGALGSVISGLGESRH